MMDQIQNVNVVGIRCSMRERVMKEVFLDGELGKRTKSERTKGLARSCCINTTNFGAKEGFRFYFYQCHVVSFMIG